MSASVCLIYITIKMPIVTTVCMIIANSGTGVITHSTCPNAKPTRLREFDALSKRIMGPICSSHPDCCDGNAIYLDKYVNQTYACTHHYCYPNATQPLNHNCSSNLTGIIYNAPIDYTQRRRHEEELRRIAEQKRLYVEIPLMLSQITGILSIFCSTIVCWIFIGILLYQPMM